MEHQLWESTESQEAGPDMPGPVSLCCATTFSSRKEGESDVSTISHCASIQANSSADSI